MIFHVVTQADWTAEPELPYAPQDLESVGFVHCSADRPTAVAIAGRHYRDEPGPLLAVEIDERALTCEVSREGATSARYPHVYGPIERAAVRRVWEIRREADGTPVDLVPWFHGS
ncbi:DUF952 domain-containing protein [Streptomyces sp. NPDC006879]|uniref:DUF952 domain-containing protein n=1 Tax=Streptomyces sp. NPDC006879 TaxID=3364767 RepID=UPI00367E13EE